MKKSLRLLSALLALCVLAATFPTVGLAAEGTVYNIPKGTDLYEYLQQDAVPDGAVIQCEGTVYAPKSPKSDDPWVINKRITIQGGAVDIATGGILLGADVTFKDTQLKFGKPICNAIVANGYTLTLDNVTAGSSGYSFNVFCGTLAPNSKQTFAVPDSGSTNTVIIRGNTNLQSGNTTENITGKGNIYAGSLSLGSMDPAVDEAGAVSDFAGNPTIRIEGCANVPTPPLGTIYASGAQQRNTFDVNAHKPTTQDLSKYTVSGAVTIRGGNKLPTVDGATSSDGRGTANVVYQGDDILATKTFQDISSLSVESGNLALEQDSYFRNGGALSLSSGAKLDLTAFKITTLDGVGSYRGDNGFVVLDPAQTWSIDGQASGTTTVVIGSLSSNGTNSMKLPEAGHTYIHAPNSNGAIFQLLPYSTQPDMTLENDGSGNWIAKGGTSGGDEEESKLISLNPAPNTQVSSGIKEAIIPLNPKCTVGSELPWESLPFSIYVNGQKATFDTDSNCYMVGGLGIYVGDFFTGNGVVLSVGNADLTYETPVPDDTYTIQITVPGEYTESGNDVTASCTLTVGDSAPAVKFIDVPTANPGLKWTGAEQTGVNEGTGYTLTGHKGTAAGGYAATATLEPNYRWTNGSTDPQTISWSIDKAAGPAAPGNLSAAAPTTAGGMDGAITGTTSAMEYAADTSFSNARDCGEPETTGLAAGPYYVRLKETTTHHAGAYALITVPVPGAPTVQSISVNSAAHKTEYSVGDSLDVTGLTILAVYSDGSQRTVSVTPDMVSGFDSSSAAERQALTITYEGKTTAYTVGITASEEPGKPKYQVTLNNLGDGGSGGGSYEEGSTVTIRAGSKSGYTFSAWQQPEGVTLVNRNSPETSFTMPGKSVTLQATWTPNGGTPPSHAHAWDSAWKSNDTHHWHDCTASGCPITQDGQKDGYAAHTAGDWVVDQEATPSQSGIRHRSCAVCGYEMARETIPATGGGPSSGDDSSSGGGSSSGDDSFSGGGSSSGGGTSSGDSSNNTSTVKNPDGSTTATSNNKTTGTVTETTRRPDGSKTVVETKKDGTVTTTDTKKDGSTVKTVARPDGTAETTVKQADGLTASVRENGNGASADVSLPSKVVQESQSGGGAVALPIPELPGTNASITIRTGSVRPVRVEIPVRGDEDTTVACLVNSDGSETLLKTAILAGGQITVSIPDGATVRIRDNGEEFQDTKGHWAESAIDFVSARELFSGMGPNTFAPEDSMSRAMLMTVLARLDGVDTTGGSAYEKGLAWAAAQGISDGQNPDGQATREQFVVMLHRYAGSPAATERELRFSDAEKVSAYAREAIRWAMENGILSGYEDGSVRPGGKTTRAQAAAILARYVKFLNRQ